jgi:carlactone synthase/all-trans-10'-apo-beta-carotenal 13,14-cleaving dioxygenase
MNPTMSSSLCTFAALAGSAGRPGRRAGQKGGNKRAVAQPLAAGAVTEAPAAVVVAPPARPVVTAPRRREGRTGGSGTDQLVAWKSIRQERWEGALQVEGELPLWLVGDRSSVNYLHVQIYITASSYTHASIPLCAVFFFLEILHSILQLT